MYEIIAKNHQKHAKNTQYCPRFGKNLTVYTNRVKEQPSSSEMAKASRLQIGAKIAFCSDRFYDMHGSNLAYREISRFLAIDLFLVQLFTEHHVSTCQAANCAQIAISSLYVYQNVFFRVV